VIQSTSLADFDADVIDVDVDGSATEQLTFLAFKLNIESTSSYANDVTINLLRECGIFNEPCSLNSSYLVCEVRDDLEFKLLLPSLSRHSHLALYFHDDVNVHPKNGDLYTSVLKKHTESERLARMSSKIGVCSEENRNENQKVILGVCKENFVPYRLISVL